MGIGRMRWQEVTQRPSSHWGTPYQCELGLVLVLMTRDAVVLRSSIRCGLRGEGTGLFIPHSVFGAQAGSFMFIISCHFHYSLLIQWCISPSQMKKRCNCLPYTTQSRIREASSLAIHRKTFPHKSVARDNHVDLIVKLIKLTFNESNRLPLVAPGRSTWLQLISDKNAFL